MIINLSIFRRVAVWAGCAFVATNIAFAQEEADKAWKDVEAATRQPSPPAEWQTERPSQEQIAKFRAETAEKAGKGADAAGEFLRKYPNHPKAVEARKRQEQLLNFAVQLGNTNKLADLNKLEAERLKDPTLNEEERFKLRARSLMRGAMSDEASFEKAARTLIKEFPKRDEGYQFLLRIAAGSDDEAKAAAIIKEVQAASVSDAVKEAATELSKEAEANAAANRKKLERVGKPLAITFKAVDGRDVDLGKMKGKVVLVDFWATWCGPCVAEMPKVIKAYEKLNPKGFEIVGISFDQEKDDLVNFTKEKKMAWPQFFDGKGWKNTFGQEFGINSIPTMWLVDKKGVLRDVNARADLESKVAKLLAE